MPETYRGAVYPWHCDHMGHMNVMWYVGKFDEGTWNLFSSIGLTAPFLRTQGRGMAAVCVLTAVHIDTATRRSCALPGEVIERARALVRSYDVAARR